MNNIKLTLVSATSSINGGYILKLQNVTTEITPFGNKEQSITYYMKVAALATVKVGNKVAPIAPGYVAEMDIDSFDMVVRDYVVPEGEDAAGQVIPLKWLQLKPAA